MSDQKIEVNDEVYATGQNGRFVVVGFNGGMAILPQFADEKATGMRIYFERTTEVPISVLSVFGKNHQKPSIHKVVRI